MGDKVPAKDIKSDELLESLLKVFVVVQHPTLKVLISTNSGVW